MLSQKAQIEARVFQKMLKNFFSLALHLFLYLLGKNNYRHLGLKYHSLVLGLPFRNHSQN
jgi:hypothetical protein